MQNLKLIQKNIKPFSCENPDPTRNHIYFRLRTQYGNSIFWTVSFFLWLFLLQTCKIYKIFKNSYKIKKKILLKIHFTKK